MKAYRLSKAAHQAGAFSGEGARIAGGRWNFKGRRMVCCSESRALAAMELFVNLDPGLAPPQLVLIPAEIPDALITEITVPLPPLWRSYPAPDAVKTIGSKWLDSHASVGLLVPSAVMPQERNLLLNPEHPKFDRLKLGIPSPFSFDERMWKGNP